MLEILAINTYPMEVYIRVSRINVRKQVTSIEVKTWFAIERMVLDDFCTTVSIYDRDGHEYTYTGPVSSKTRDIVEKCGMDASLKLIRDRKVKVFSEEEQPILHCIYKSGETIKLDGLCKLFVFQRYFSRKYWKILAATRVQNFSRLKRIKLMHCDIKEVPNFVDMNLTHLDMSHNNISGYLNVIGRFSSVILSHNNILGVSWVDTKDLHISYNSICEFSMQFPFRRLDLSHNPLKKYSGKALVLDLSHTKLVFLKTSAEELTLDGTKNICPENFENLRQLSMNNCRTTVLDIKAPRLKILKARNNFLEKIPHIQTLEYLDVSGNLIHEVTPHKNVRFLDASRNRIVNFDLNEWDQLTSLDLSYNPMMRLRLRRSIGENMEFLNLRGTNLHKKLDVPEKYHKHKCVTKNKIVERLVIGKRNHMYEAMFLISIMNSGVTMSEISDMVVSGITNVQDPHEYFSRFYETLRRILHFMQLDVKFALCMITRGRIFFRIVRLSIMFSNFSGIRILESKDVMYIYDNIGSWNIIPLFCKLEKKMARFDMIDTCKNDLRAVLRFVEHKCPFSLKMSISSMLPKFDLNRRVLTASFLDTKMTYKLEARRCILTEKISTPVCRCRNYNPTFSSSVRWRYDSLLYNPNPIFTFCRFGISDKRQNRKYIVGNVRNIMKMITCAFFGTCLELSEEHCITVFHDRIEACLWALKVKNILKHVGLDVGIGITCDIFYTRIIGNHVRFYGPALNKVARLSKLGIGIFCCHCVWTKSTGVFYASQGTRYLNGFKDSHLIYIPRLVEDYGYCDMIRQKSFH